MQTLRAARVSPSTSVARPAISIASNVEQMAEEMVRRWRQGERPLAEEFLARLKEPGSHPEAAFELIAEELALRSEFQMPVTCSELSARFPQWEQQVAALFECQQALGPHISAPNFPSPGDWIGDFQLTSLLGRGVQGQVFLAIQPALAARPVVLKLGPAGGVEHLSLARLQHTHIVPLYSAHDFPERGLHGLCMPYFGGVTLAALVSAIDDSGKRLGGPELRELLKQLDASPQDFAPHSPAWSFLEHASANETVSWICACLADALHYAHERGLLHLDLKPSNVLIAADATPMLLDFHLARPPLQKGEPAPARLGGTTGYMPAEQEAALREVAQAGTIQSRVDGRADIFGLGVLLEQLLQRMNGKQQPESVGLTDILARCTATNAENRYPSAAMLAADFRRHLSAMPLKGVRNRSWRERWDKWRRRRPYALALALTLGALILVCAGLMVRSGQQVRNAEAALDKGERHLANRQYREAAEVFRGGEALIDGVPGQVSLRQRLRFGLMDAERGQVAADLHALCEQVRPLYGAVNLPPRLLASVAGQCRALWDQREAIARQLLTQSSIDDPIARSDLLDLGVLTAHLEVQSASAESKPASHRRALETLAQAEEIAGPSTVLWLERAHHQRSLQLVADATASMERANNRSPQTAWEYLVIGRAALADSALPRAIKTLELSLALNPGSLWANYYLGLCYLRQERPTEALAAFAACASLAPESAWCIYNRGLAYFKIGNSSQALRDFDRALAIDSQFVPALISRAALYRQEGRTSDAEADMRRAKELGADANNSPN